MHAWLHLCRSQPARIRRRQWLAGLLLGAASVAQSQGAAAAATPAPAEVVAELPEARWRGSGTLRFLGLHIYDARLWSAAPITADAPAQPLALELIYARALVGEQIASRSLKEMQRVGSFTDAQGERWLRSMTALFPDVQAGDRITGVYQPGRAARFFHNGTLRGEVPDADFARLFFSIWLSPKTSEPRLRAQLLGGG